MDGIPRRTIMTTLGADKAYRPELLGGGAEWRDGDARRHE